MDSSNYDIAERTIHLRVSEDRIVIDCSICGDYLDSPEHRNAGIRMGLDNPFRAFEAAENHRDYGHAEMGIDGGFTIYIEGEMLLRAFETYLGINTEE